MKREEKIKTRSFFRICGHLIQAEALNTEQRAYAGVKLREAFLNGLFRGKAVFSPPPLPPPEDVFPEYYEKKEEN